MPASEIVGPEAVPPVGLPGTVSETGYQLPEGLDFETWEQVGMTLLAMGRSVLWWVGDWIRYGEAAYGERYSQALEVTGFEYGTLRDAVWVAEHVDPRVRRADLPFWHHREVAPLENAQQQRQLLARAVDEGWTRTELKAAARDLRTDLPARRAPTETDPPPCATDADDSAHAASEGPIEASQDPGARWITCPSCGHDFIG